MARVLHVGNLADTVDDRDLASMFDRYGVVRTATVVHCAADEDGGTVTGRVEMASENCGSTAIALMHGQEYRGRIVSVRWATFRDAADAERLGRGLTAH